jgi:ketosteroid isomerase-like protein
VAGPSQGLSAAKMRSANSSRVSAKPFRRGLQTEIRKTHAAGDAVIVELTNRGKAFNGKDYEKEFYCFVFELEGGKIRRIREYVDMLKVVQTLS